MNKNCKAVFDLLYFILLLLPDMWDKGSYDYPWPTSDLTKIFRSFHPSHLQEALDSVPMVQKVVFIQVNQTYDENGEYCIYMLWLENIFGWKFLQPV